LAAKHILFFGPRSPKSKSGADGGVTVLYEDFLRYAHEEGLKYKNIDTYFGNYPHPLIAFFLIIIKSLFLAPSTSFFFLNGTANDYFFLAPILAIIKKIFNKKLILRKFAGNFDLYYNESGTIKKKIAAFALKQADICFWETKYLVEFGKQFNSKSVWFPNVRKKSHINRDRFREYRKKFIYIGQVSIEKGVDNLINVSKRLEDGVFIDVYGNLKDPLNEDKFHNSKCHYKGKIENSKVFDLLSEYDILIIPSKRSAEGYPGVIIEAFAVGLPVIASRIGGIPEIVDNYNDGILINPGDEDDIYNALTWFDQEKFTKMSESALNKFDQFDSDKVTKYILSHIQI